MKLTPVGGNTNGDELGELYNVLPTIAQQNPQTLQIVRLGDCLTSQSTFTLVAQGQRECAILVDRWGVFHVTDEDGRLQYIGDNEVSAEVAFWMEKFRIVPDVVKGESYEGVNKPRYELPRC